MAFRASSMAGKIALLLLSSSAPAFAEDIDLTGHIDFGGRVLGENQSSARFHEYRDIDDGVIGGFRVDLTKGSYYMTLLGENVGLTTNHVGLDDQFFILKGGRYDKFKYSLFYNETPHNLSFDARTFYTGVGTGSLSFTGAAPTPTNFPARYNNFFDYQVNRRDYGASAEISMGTPFYLTLSVSENDKKGLQPMGGATGTPGGGFVEFPMPVQYYTRNLTAEAGYRTKQLVFSIDGMVSDFDNSNPYVTWTSPALVGMANTTQTTSVAPDSNYWRVGGKLHVRLPLDSALTLKGSYAKAENNLRLLTSVVNNTTGTLVSLGNSGTFKGEYTYINFFADLTVHPVKILDIRLYYHFLDRGNDSSVITFTNSTSGDVSENELFDYSKHTAGLEISSRLAYKTKATAGYEYQRVNRDADIRPDALNTSDNTVFVQLRNNFLDFLTARVKYRHLERRSDFENFVGTVPTDAEYIRRFVRRFDATDKSQDAAKLSFDFYPLDQLQLGVEYDFKHNEYFETVLGRIRDNRHEVYFDAQYIFLELFKISAYFDYEWVTAVSRHRNFVPGLSGSPEDPAETTNPANPSTGNSTFNWRATLKDNNYAYGIGVEIPVIKNRLNLVAAWGYERASGEADFSDNIALSNSANTITLTDIGHYDDYSKKAVNAKVVYKVNLNLDLVAGYAYEKYKYNDASYEGYTLVPTAGNYLTGAYADHDYEAHLWFLSATYRF